MERTERVRRQLLGKIVFGTLFLFAANGYTQESDSVEKGVTTTTQDIQSVSGNQLFQTLDASTMDVSAIYGKACEPGYDHRHTITGAMQAINYVMQERERFGLPIYTIHYLYASPELLFVEEKSNRVALSDFNIMSDKENVAQAMSLLAFHSFDTEFLKRLSSLKEKKQEDLHDAAFVLPLDVRQSSKMLRFINWSRFNWGMIEYNLWRLNSDRKHLEKAVSIFQNITESIDDFNDTNGIFSYAVTVTRSNRFARISTRLNAILDLWHLEGGFTLLDFASRNADFYLRDHLELFEASRKTLEENPGWKRLPNSRGILANTALLYKLYSLNADRLNRRGEIILNPAEKIETILSYSDKICSHHTIAELHEALADILLVGSAGVDNGRKITEGVRHYRKALELRDAETSPAYWWLTAKKIRRALTLLPESQEKNEAEAKLVSRINQLEQTIASKRAMQKNKGS